MSIECPSNTLYYAFYLRMLRFLSGEPREWPKFLNIFSKHQQSKRAVVRDAEISKWGTSENPGICTMHTHTHRGSLRNNLRTRSSGRSPILLEVLVKDPLLVSPAFLLLCCLVHTTKRKKPLEASPPSPSSCDFSLNERELETKLLLVLYSNLLKPAPQLRVKQSRFIK